MGTTIPVCRRLSLAALPLAVLLTIPSLSLPARSADEVRIHVDGRTITLAQVNGTVGEALAAARLKLNRNDQVTPGLDEPVPFQGAIRITRVEHREVTQEIRLPYATLVRAPVSGRSRPYHPTVTAEGRDGLKRIVYSVKVIDGRVVEKVKVSEAVVRKPVDQVVTSRKPQVLASRGAYTGRRTLRLLATAYDPGPGSCGNSADGKTCNGKRAGYGIVAVDPRVIPLGTKLLVEGYGYGIASDVGGAIKGNRIDLGFNSRSGSMKWGKKWVSVSILD